MCLTLIGRKADAGLQALKMKPRAALHTPAAHHESGIISVAASNVAARLSGALRSSRRFGSTAGCCCCCLVMLLSMWLLPLQGRGARAHALCAQEVAADCRVRSSRVSPHIMFM